VFWVTDTSCCAVHLIVQLKYEKQKAVGLLAWKRTAGKIVALSEHKVANCSSCEEDSLCPVVTFFVSDILSDSTSSALPGCSFLLWMGGGGAWNGEPQRQVLCWEEMEFA
jgi:hypothetical protein